MIVQSISIINSMAFYANVKALGRRYQPYNYCYYCVPFRYSRCLFCVFSFRQVHCISFVCSTFGRFRALEVHTHLAQGYGRFCEA